MALVRCNLSSGRVKLPDSVTYTGTVHVGHDGYTNISNGRGDGKILGRTSITIPTLGYQKADVTINAPGSNTSSSVGKGSNIDISNKSSINITAETGKASVNWHAAYNYYFGNADGNYTVVLHN
ncbi:MAG: hypothetical protein K2K87_14310 [Lachnospiraceae bacterium]|nr:hypothetical protein [Lachnospiraceae bacterium]